MKLWQALKLWVIRRYIYYFVQSDREEKCPCCGMRQLHDMKYDTDSKKILHRCRTLHTDEKHTFGCGAIWATDPLVNAANWEVVMKVQDEEGRTDMVQPDKKFVVVTREPQVIKKDETKQAS